jgi:hypothetical protein
MKSAQAGLGIPVILLLKKKKKKNTQASNKNA